MQNAITAYIGLGSNLGDRQDFIDKAVKMLSEAEGIEFANKSDVIETEPLGGKTTLSYLNTVVAVNTSLPPEELLKKINNIEKTLGRVRQIKLAPRTIDLDLLMYGQEIISRPQLTVPHSQLHLRTFALAGLCQLKPTLLHPVLKEPVTELARRLNGANYEVNPNVPQILSVAGVTGVGKTTLAKELASHFNCTLIREPYDTNPFMPKVYDGNKDLALDSQLFFLADRTKHLNSDNLQNGKIVITDYIFDKEQIYANCLLNATQLEFYEMIYEQLATNLAAPVLVIYLKASVQICLERIQRRNRPYEQTINLDFLQTLEDDYEKLFHSWKSCPVIQLSTTEDFDIEHLAKQIKSYVASL